MRASEVSLSENEEVELQRILAESFDISHLDFSREQAIENLRKNFEGKVGLCSECLMAKPKTMLAQYGQCCQECYEEQNLELEPREKEEATPSP